LPRIGLKQQTALGPQGSFEWRMLPGNIAWVQLRSFNDDSAAKAFDSRSTTSPRPTD
jgi:hypothetical protein